MYRYFLFISTTMQKWQGILFRLELSRYFSNIDRTKVSSLPWAMLLYNFYIFCVPECLFNPSVITTFFVIAHYFCEKLNENSLLVRLGVLSLCLQRGEAFTMVLLEIALPSVLCRPVLRTKSKLQRRIVKCHRSREIFSWIYLFFSILSRKRVAENRNHRTL